MMNAVLKMRRGGNWVSRRGAMFTAVCMMVSMTTGCPFIPPQTLSVVDLAVGSPNGLILDKDIVPGPYDTAKVLLYFDVLQGDNQQDPEVVITSEDIELAYPADIVLTESDLYVADMVTDRVLIWRDYRGLEAKGGSALEPDVILTTEIENPTQIIVEDNRLFVLSDGAPGGVAIFGDAAGITADVAPDTFVEFGDALAMEYEDDILYVGGFAYVLGKVSEEQAVVVYPSVTGLLEPDLKGLLAEDIVVLAGPSWANLDDNGPVIPQGLRVVDNELFVSTQVNFLFTFSPADALVDEQVPDAIISETNGALLSPKAMEAVGCRLFVGNSGLSRIRAKEEKSNSVGMVAFDDATNVVTGQTPDVVFDTSSAQISAVMDLASEENVLFVAASNASPVFLTKIVPFGSYYTVGDVHIYLDADDLPFGWQADIVLPAMKDFTVPTAIDVNAQFTGN
ncbi:MAG: hypothetical protein IT364_21680 [Candidatus Hydrogenedentes bacterium]|nr:hypothetical protein [Candidatus Hydrogenedentota bacterium]